ncbi:MAG: SGNH/GDSL hydrolase family protein [Pirellulales bacterium]|nr:SGNH/GDSL hydrolase family protein [Pirellulales bacterium]
MTRYVNRSAGSNRRGFFSTAASLAGVGLGVVAASRTSAAEKGNNDGHAQSFIKPGATILFQGDSITDAGRNRESAGEANSQPALGNGYAWLAASQLLVDRPDDGLKIYNRGISGNKVYQLAERWQPDCLDLKPDVLSILIGVNDLWHTLGGAYDGSVEKYDSDYRKLLAQTRQALPAVKLVICEPFVLRCGAVDDSWFPQFDAYRAAARKLADEAGAVFVPLQAMFDAASQLAPPERWAKDGVHPSADGAALMAHTWRKMVDEA